MNIYSASTLWTMIIPHTSFVRSGHCACTSSLDRSFPSTPVTVGLFFTTMILMVTSNVFHCYKFLILLLYLQSGSPHFFMNNVLLSSHDPSHPFLKSSKSLIFVKSLLIITSTRGCNTVLVTSIFARQWSTPPSWKQSQWCTFYDSKWNMNGPTHHHLVVHFSPCYWTVSECHSRADDYINTLVTSLPEFIKSSNELWIGHDRWRQNRIWSIVMRFKATAPYVCMFK